MNNFVNVSVVVATCNGERFIEQQISSLLEIIGENDEIVVGDDASTDQTIDKILKINDNRIRIIRFENRVGYQKNFERAIFESRGEYIFFSDQDDVCLSERYSNSLEALKTFGCVVGDAVVTDEFLVPSTLSYFKQRRVKNFNVWRLFTKPCAIGATMACTRKFLISALPFPKDVPHDFWLSLLASSRGELAVVFVPFILYRRHQDVISLTGMKKKRSIIMILKERVHIFYFLAKWWISRVFSN